MAAEGVNIDYIHNGSAHGSVAETLLDPEFDLRALRPWKSRKTRRNYVTSQGPNGKLVNNYTPNPATLYKDEWIRLDEIVIEEVRNRLTAYGDLLDAGLVYNLANGMDQSILQWQTQSESGNAKVSMEGIAKAERDRPEVDLRGIPLPLIHSDFWFPLRELRISRKHSNPIDMTEAENCARRIAETIEDMTIGNVSAYSYGGYSIPGYTTFTDRIAYTITSPEAGGWTPATLIDEVLDMKEQARLVNFFGPFYLYLGAAWERFLDGDFSSAYTGVTLRDRLAKITKIDGIRLLDNLSGYQVLLVQKTKNVVRAVNGIGLTTVQWPSEGGFKLNWKIFCMMLINLRSTFTNKTGLVHGNTA